MHSFEVNIRICQPENSDVHPGEENSDVHRGFMIYQPKYSNVHRGFGEHHCLGLTNPDVNLKRMHKLCIDQEKTQITDQLMAPREVKRHTTPTGADPGFLESGFNSNV